MPSFFQKYVVLPQAVPPSICEEIIDIGMNHYIEYGQIGGSENGLEDHHIEGLVLHGWIEKKNYKMDLHLTTLLHI